ncbi:hypothetical protein OG455_38565 [Kitasatospora sp. NBC_01287]|uniref:hypothetical protein n=1 Tax=Kitasatospora sp. NBC_01287 TaxID=2903573 RepID=UPI00225087CF|nr:hypothetical protein [Kitasatospora sp. NBC_01287]MCX4751340.1 hypothetical protein [Kitasatospora sp. NBC_01287]
MYQVLLALAAVNASLASPTDAHLVNDILLAYATPRHGLEHIRARAAADGVDVVLFMKAATASEAVANARALVDVVSERVELLSRYSATLHLRA